MQNDQIYWDYIFVGLGASIGTAVQVMHERGDLQGKRILAIDPDEKIKNDKTYCFWSEDSHAITQSFQEITDAQWSQIGIDQHPPQSIDPQKYRHIRSEALYARTKKTLEHYNATVLIGRVMRLTDVGEWVEVRTQRAQFLGRHVFDSRPPAMHTDRNRLWLWQSFVGVRVACDWDAFDEDVYTMMDFSIPQDNATQFIYILPFSKRTALIELTRFGIEKIEAQTARKHLDSYIQERFGSVRELDLETGAIPMTDQSFEPDESPRITRLGTAAGRVKPSTGYSFLRSYEHATQLADRNFAFKKPSAWNRFAFYDTLLLTILARWPHWGAPIFKALFQRVAPQRVLKFLDERTSVWEDIALFSALPFTPFLRALLVVNLARMRSLPYATALGVALLYGIIGGLFPAGASYLRWAWLGLGLLTVGIPHGALDHQVYGIEKNAQDLFFFLIRYLTVMAGVVLLWLITPFWGLVTFLIYSIIHFGETDQMAWHPGRMNRWRAYAWGTTVFAVLLLPHLEEVNAIIQVYQLHSLALPLIFTQVLPFALLGIWGCYGLIIRHRGIATSILLLALTTQFDLIMAFGLYFIGQHSTTVWKQLQSELQASSTQLYVRALPYTIGAFTLLAGGYYTWGNTSNFWPLFFVFLAAISLPHTFLFSRWYRVHNESSAH